MCFVWISEQTAIISVYNINWLVFITQTQCVYRAVRTGYLNAVQVNPLRSIHDPPDRLTDVPPLSRYVNMTW